MKHYPVSLVALAVAAFLSSPSFACEQHPQGHAALTTATTAPEPVVTPAPAEPPAMTPRVEADEAALSVREEAGFIGCPQMRKKQQTVYLTN